jgi:hypothetical protein
VTYQVTFQSNHIYIHHSASKTEVDSIMAIKAAKLQFSRLKSLTSDGGPDLTAPATKQCMLDLGIKHDATPPRAAQRLGSAESKQYRTVAGARASTMTAGIPKATWPILQDHVANVNNIIANGRLSTCRKANK